jgi:hypothetical protein
MYVYIDIYIQIFVTNIHIFDLVNTGRVCLPQPPVAEEISVSVRNHSRRSASVSDPPTQMRSAEKRSEQRAFHMMGDELVGWEG